MEKKIELENGSKLAFTIKFGDKECSEYGSDDHVKIERNSTIMDETERKFIIMARIAVALRRKGLHCSVSIQESNYCTLNVFLHTSPGEGVIVSDITSYDVTEDELLDWWSVIKNGVE